MINIAFIPSCEEHLNPTYNYANVACAWFPYSRDNLNMYNIKFDVIDAFPDWNKVDLFLFCNTYTFHYKYYMELMRRNLLTRCIYFAHEPNVVMPWHTEKYVNKILRFFPLMASTNDNMISEKVLKLIVPCLFDTTVQKSGLAYCDKKLMCNISSNNTSLEKNELYSERLKVIQWFDENHPEDFDLYGFDWSEYSVNRGRCENKKDVYNQHRFALCLENNISDSIGDVTEKIFHCFQGNIVPIYYGCKVIDRYIPKETYILYDNFSSLDELYTFISEMGEETYEKYLQAAAKYMNAKDHEPWDLDSFRVMLLNLVEQVKVTKWKMRKWSKVLIYVYELKRKLKEVILYLYLHSYFVKKVWRKLKK